MSKREWHDCNTCRGSGTVWKSKDCTRCKGSGKLEGFFGEKTCPKCDGHGYRGKDVTCPECHGKGRRLYRS